MLFPSGMLLQYDTNSGKHLQSFDVLSSTMNLSCLDYNEGPTTNVEPFATQSFFPHELYWSILGAMIPKEESLGGVNPFQKNLSV